MMISKIQVQNLLKIYSKDNTNKVEPKQFNKIPGKNDELAISSESRIKHRAMQAIKQAEDVRLDKVNHLQEQISSGTYTVSDDEVAEKMIARAIVDRLV
ncbi:MAG: flagellar biosynthesis anti-sigma factor FlgM [Syntrophomonadaceae bacterium]|jgi:negative regulator of flagellin synthesis FlgM|nr:flagellar biosynthesis anti-sigma factor FlgM [Syntrophomonadaceae bacterium]